MKLSRMYTTLLLGLFTFSFVLVGCGDDKDGDAAGDDAGTEATSSESSGSSDGGSLGDLSKELYETLASIESVDDAKAAEGKIGEIFDNMAEQMREVKDDPSKAMEMQTDPTYMEYQEKMQEQITKLTTENPQIGMEIGRIMLDNSEKLMEVAQEMMEEHM